MALPADFYASLRHGERVVREQDAEFQVDTLAGIGRVYLTNERLVWVPGLNRLIDLRQRMSRARNPPETTLPLGGITETALVPRVFQGTWLAVQTANQEYRIGFGGDWIGLLSRPSLSDREIAIDFQNQIARLAGLTDLPTD